MSLLLTKLKDTMLLGVVTLFALCVCLIILSFTSTQENLWPDVYAGSYGALAFFGIGLFFVLIRGR